MDEVARQLIRALRGGRSQVALARKLGYRSNPVAEWEGGRRFPTAAETLRIAARSFVDVPGAFEAFHPGAAPALGEADDAGVAAWLDALRGQTPIQQVADTLQTSRSAASRWFSGATRPRLPVFLQLVQVLTGRLPDLVGALVDIDRVPALADEHRRLQASRRLAFDVPWTEAVLQVLETRAYRALPRHRDAWIATALGMSVDEVREALERLVQAGVVQRAGGTYTTAGAMSVDTRDRREALVRLKTHWVDVARARLRTPRDEDYFGYNVFSVSRADLQRLRELHVAYYRSVRAIVARSEPSEVVALINVQLMDWDTNTTADLHAGGH